MTMGFSLGGAAGGAATGAQIGSIIPGIGTGIGAAIGGLAGLFGGRKKPKLKSTAEYMRMGQGAVNDSVNAAVSSAMPQFQDQIQGLRESAINRGVQYGDIGTRNEGSLASAFQRNLANLAGSQSMQLYQTALDQRAGRQDQLAMRANNRDAEMGAFADILGRGLATKTGSKLASQVTGAVGGRLGGLFGGRNRTMRSLPSLPRQSADTMRRPTFGGVQRMP
jgi:hypothetical protein